MTILKSASSNWWLEVVYDDKGFSSDEVHHALVDMAAKQAKWLRGDDFNDMIPDDDNKLIDAHSQTLMEITKSAIEKEKQGVGLTLDHLATMVRVAK